MKRNSYSIPFAYRYAPEHKGAPYTIDGEHYMNAGELCETAIKAALGFDARKDASTPFDAGSDIPELHASVKSSKATLTGIKLGATMDEILGNYFKRVASTLWIWVVLIDETVTAYEMNREEFESFTREFARVEREVVRYKTSSSKMIQWLEERAA